VSTSREGHEPGAPDSWGIQCGHAQCPGRETRNIEKMKTLTFVIPTHNRPQFLRRLFRYASEVGIESQILVLDSSNPGLLRENKDSVARYQDSLRIRHLPINETLMRKMQIGVRECQTPYVAFWADDDFQIPEGVARCVQFLEDNKEHQSCTASFASASTLGRELQLSIATHPERNEEEAVDRITLWAEDFYSTFYSVFRTPMLVRSLDLAADITAYEKCRIIPEILMGQLALLYGRQGSIADVSILYQVHAANESRILRPVHNDEVFQDEYARYRAGLGREIQAVLNMPSNESSRLVDATFRLVYRWTGGRLWIYRKLVENLRRSLKRMFPNLMKTRRSGAQFTKAKVDVSDPRMEKASIRVALQLVQAFPDGMQADEGA
jgi:glycosyltransferase domain-containing protein